LAATIQVTSCKDDGSSGTLRQAFSNLASGDVVDMSGLACTPSTITLLGGALGTSVNDLLVKGPSTGLTISGNDADRVLIHTGAGKLTLRDVTITHGLSQGSGPAVKGGCINSNGDVTLDRVTVADCTIRRTGGGVDNNPVRGGGVYAQGQAVLVNATISGNLAESVNAGGVVASGGGIAAHTVVGKYSTISDNEARSPFRSRGGGTVADEIIFVGSTLNGNRATGVAGAPGYGGAIYTSGASTLTIRNSTISGNFATTMGGGILANSLPVALSNSTVAFNRSGVLGGGIAATFHDVVSNASIIAGNTAADLPADVDLGPNYALLGAHNLILQANVALPLGTITADPRLTPLGNHGGLTLTHALLATSPAIDNGSNVQALATDQRKDGFARENPTGASDIGAYERQVNDDEIYFDGFNPPGT
jgi:hypothetical protein